MTVVPELPVSLMGLGKCEHCDGTVSLDLELQRKPGAESLSCPHCHRGISFAETFGFKPKPSSFKKVSWIGPDGNRTDVKPEDDFNLGPFRVLVGAKLVVSAS